MKRASLDRLRGAPTTATDLFVYALEHDCGTVVFAQALRLVLGLDLTPNSLGLGRKATLRGGSSTRKAVSP